MLGQALSQFLTGFWLAGLLAATKMVGRALLRALSAGICLSERSTLAFAWVLRVRLLLPPQAWF
jgi:hypothetical protein